MIFLDLETTGLDRDRQGKDLTGHHLILEIGMLAINMPEMTEAEAWSTPIRHAKHQVLEKCDDYVLKMHTESGLTREIFDEPYPANNRAAGGLPIEVTAEEEALAFLMRNVDGRDRPELCGANPSFDRAFLRTRMPKLEAAFHYRSFDTNTFWLTRKFFGDWDGQKDQQAHRALPDCRREFQALLDHFVWAGQVMRGER
jgi:oligoribonuclease (3'-5' exoribonuclease)